LALFLKIAIIPTYFPQAGDHKKVARYFYTLKTKEGGQNVVQILCAIFVYGVNSLLPNVMGVMKYIGAAYILWLAAG
jgi:hypothetical protein